MTALVGLKPDLQERVLNYCESNKVYLTNARSKAGFLVAACEKARKGALDERGFGAVDPYKEYLLALARPRKAVIDLVPEAEWLQRFTDAQEVVFNVKADPEIGVSTLRLALQLTHSVRAVKERLIAVGVGMPIHKMRLREANVGYLRDERTLAYYNLSSGSQLHLMPKKRAGRRLAPGLQ
ncbi:unnamed protein product [Durusdinium trenchii]|uniref:Uncharacterized protein n=2 Tax=Durusdinium trenchii TaxID=1381693 RepID=A0ABP0SWS7_9DINO